MNKNTELQKIENLMEIERKIETNSKEFEKIMFIYATSKELIQCAKMVNKLDNKMMVLNTN